MKADDVTRALEKGKSGR